MDVLGKHRKSERIGRLNQQIAVQSVSEAVNAYGERVETWSTAATIWAQVEYNAAASKEGEQAGQEQAMQEVLFTVRVLTINEKYRIVFDGKTFDIQGIAKSNDRQFLTLRCVQVDQ